MTANDLLDHIRRTGVLDAETLENALRRLREKGYSADSAQAMADALVAESALTAFQARLLVKGQAKGLVLAGKYRILDILGEGGMGRVFLAEHTSLRRLVAIKVLPASAAETQGVVERFRREARAVASFNDPNILQVFDVDQSGKTHFMVLEYVAGSTLDQLVSRIGPLPIDRACSYLSQACLGMHHAHLAGWVHRDIKPANLLLDRKGMVKILDLGLARLFRDSADNLTAQYDKDSVMGTADYMAPEQALSVSSADVRSDIYSLGATLFYLLTGQPPFAEGTVAQKLMAHQVKTAPRVTSLRPEIPRPLSDVVARALTKSPKERFQSALELAEALHPWTPEEIAPPAASDFSPSNSGDDSPSRQQTVSPGAPRTGAKSSMRGLSVHRENAEATQRTPPYKRQPRLLLVLGCVVLLAVGWAGYQARKWLPENTDAASQNNTPTQTEAPVVPTSPLVDPRPYGKRVLLVTHDKQLAARFASYAYPSVTVALTQAKSGDVIRIVGPVQGDGFDSPLFREAVVLDGAKLPAELVIDGRHPAGDGKPAGWYPPRSTVQTLLELREMSDLRLSNLVLDGEARTENLVFASSHSPGLRLSDLHLAGFQREGVILTGSGQRNRRVVLQGCRFSGANSEATALVLRSGVSDVTVADCRMEGPLGAAVRLEKAVTSVDIAACRMYRVGAAVECQGVGPARFGLTDCTIAEAKSVVRFQDLAGSNGDRVTLVNNLLVGVQSLSAGLSDLDAKDVFRDVRGNACDTNLLTTPLPTGVQNLSFAGLPTAPAYPQHFLRYPKNSPLMKAGLDGRPVGAGPQP